MTQFIIGKDQKDWKILQIDLSTLKNTASLEQINTLKTTKFNICYLAQAQLSLPLINGKISKGTLAINSPTLEKNIKSNLPLLVLAVVYRKSNKETPIGYIIFETNSNHIVYYNKNQISRNYNKIINLQNNGAEFDLKEAKLPKLNINDLIYSVGNTVNYNNKDYKIIEKDIEKDYKIRDEETKETVLVYESELAKPVKAEGKKENSTELKLQDISSKFKEIYANRGGIEVQKRNDYIIKVTAAEEGKIYYNKLEDAEYVGKAGQAVLVGTQGEEWLTKIEKVCSTYLTDTSKELTPDMIIPGKYIAIKPKTNSDKCWAVKITDKDKYFIKTSWGSELKINASKNKKGETIDHGSGDILLSYNAEGTDLSVINGKVFSKTYKKYKEVKENNSNLNIDELWKQFEEKLFKIEGYNQFVGTIGNNGFDFRYSSDKVFPLVLKGDGLFYAAGEQTKNSLSELPKYSSLRRIMLDNYTIRPEDLLAWIGRHIDKISVWAKKNNFICGSYKIIGWGKENDPWHALAFVNPKNNKVACKIPKKEEFGIYYTTKSELVSDKGIDPNKFKTNPLRDIANDSDWTIEYCEKYIKPELLRDKAAQSEENQINEQVKVLIKSINNKDFEKCIEALSELADNNDKSTLLNLINSSTEITNTEVKDAIVNIITNLL